MRNGRETGGRREGEMRLRVKLDLRLHGECPGRRLEEVGGCRRRKCEDRTLQDMREGPYREGPYREYVREGGTLQRGQGIT